MTAGLLDAALAYAARGWPVLPCAERDKRPLTAHGVKDASCDPGQIREWWARWPAANPAIAAGHMLGIADIDDMTVLEVLDWLRLADTATVSTSRGVHKYFATVAGVDLPTCKPWPGVDMRGVGAYVLAPPSVHPSGKVYTWLSEREPAPVPPELIALVRSRAPGLATAPTPALEPEPDTRHRRHISLPRLARRILRADPATLSRYTSRSEADRALLASLANSGASLELARAVYVKSQHDQHLDPQERDFEKRFAAEWVRAKSFTSHDRPDVALARARAQAVREWAQATPWIVPGSGSRMAQESARRVLIAHCNRAEAAGVSEWQMSARDIATATRVSVKTTIRAHRRLIKAGLLRQAKSAYRDMAAVWTFGDSAQSSTLTHNPPDVRKCGTLDTTAHDAFEFQALGRNIWQTYDVLVRMGSGNVNEIATAAGWSVRTTERHVLSLASHGLAAPLEDGLWAAVTSEKRLREVGAALGGAEAARRREARIQCERQAFRLRLKVTPSGPARSDAPGRWGELEQADTTSGESFDL